MEKDLIRTAIAEGFKERGFQELCTATCFTRIKTDANGSVEWRTLRTANTTIEFGDRLGLPGLLAYNLTFGNIENGTGTRGCKFHVWADKFVRNVAAVEKQRKSGSTTARMRMSVGGLKRRDPVIDPTSHQETGNRTANAESPSIRPVKLSILLRPTS